MKMPHTSMDLKLLIEEVTQEYDRLSYEPQCWFVRTYRTPEVFHRDIMRWGVTGSYLSSWSSMRTAVALTRSLLEGLSALKKPPCIRIAYPENSLETNSRQSVFILKQLIDKDKEFT